MVPSYRDGIFPSLFMIGGNTLDAMNLLTVYDRMRDLGMVGNKREFSLMWLGKGRTYLRDFIDDGRLHATVPLAVIDRLRGRLTAMADRTPAGVARDIRGVVENIDRAVVVHRLLAR